MKVRNFSPIVLMMCGASSAFPQTATVTKPAPIAATAPTVVPALVPYSAIAEGGDGKPLAGEVSMTFLLFKDESGGEPLWTETQIIPIDATGRYNAQLGASSPSGLPLETFSTGTARWLEVQITGQKPQPRTLLTTVPYAAKAADSATLGGLPASAYALVGATSNTTTLTPSAVSPDAGSTVTTTGGTSDYLPKFTGTSTIANSQIYDNGTSVGIGDVPNPSAKLDINGGVIMRGGMTVSRTGNATATKGYPSFPFGFYSNAYNSSTKGTDNPHFLLQSEPVGNNTANTGATFNFLYSNHGTAPVETGLSINSAGIVQFAPGQTFPGSGGGTITGVTAGTALTGGGTSGAVTLNLDTTKVPTLAANNIFSGSQQIKSTLSAVNGYFSDSSIVYALQALNSSYGAILGTAGGSSSESQTLEFAAGVWGDTNITLSEGNSTGLLGTADDSYAELLYNNSANAETLFVDNNESSSGSSVVFQTYGGQIQGECSINVSGNLGCSGTIAGVAKVQDGSKSVEMYSVQSPENWFEDFGSGSLNSGTARVALEATFAQTVNAGIEYHVFLTPKGDCKGLYVTNESATGFEVHELGGGISSVPFDYRIVAKRAGYENLRLADVTDQMKRLHARKGLPHPVQARPSLPSGARPEMANIGSTSRNRVRATQEPAIIE